jgi:hypothetical protein
MLASALGKSRLHWRAPLAMALALVLLCGPTGCVRRRLTVRSNPPGALVFIDNQEIGFTPVSTPYTYYGTREIKLVKDGFETLTVKQNFKAPWYEVTPVDFVSENFWPGETRDERMLDFQLVPQQIVPTERLLERAQGLRSNVQQGTLAPTVMPAPAGGLLPPGAVPGQPAFPAAPPNPSLGVPPAGGAYP